MISAQTQIGRNSIDQPCLTDFVNSACSLEIDPSEWLIEVSEEGGDTNNVELTVLVDIEVVPGGVESVEIGGGQPGIGGLSAHLQVGASDLLGNLEGVFLVDVEFTGWFWVLGAIVTLGGVLGDQVLGELVDWWDILLSGVTDESLWDLSRVGVHVVSELVDGSWETIHMWMPSVPVWKGGLEDFALLDLNEGRFIKGSGSLEQDLLVVKVISLS